MDFNEVAIFIKVIQKGSFTGAAVALDMPKSTVSTKISSLEKRLGATLIKRSTRKLQLTEVGEKYYQRVIKGLDEIMAAENTVKSEITEPQGTFRITAPVDLGNSILPQLVVPFLKKYPKVQIEFLLTDRYVDFLEDEIDLAIRAGVLKDSSLIAKKIGEVAFKLFASPQYIRENSEPKALKDLEKHICILTSTISSTEWKLQNLKRSTTVTLPKKIVVNNFNLAQNLAKEGAGITLLPSYQCVPDVKAGRLVPILDDWRSNFNPIHFVYPEQRYVQPATKAFIEIAKSVLGNQLL